MLVSGLSLLVSVSFFFSVSSLVRRMLQLNVAWSKSSSVVLEVVATGDSRQCVFLIIGT